MQSTGDLSDPCAQQGATFGTHPKGEGAGGELAHPQSSPAATYCIAGWNATEAMPQPPTPARVPSFERAVTFHKITVPSVLPLASKVPSRPHATAVTEPVWPESWKSGARSV